MIFKRKSKFEKVSDAAIDVFESLGSANPMPRRTRFQRTKTSFNLLTVVVPLVWANRDKIKKAVDSARQLVKDRLEASKEVLLTGSLKSTEQSQQQPSQQQSQDKAA
jgi:hypothetical protein